MAADVRPANAPPLRISYLLQQFPLATQTFAVSDIAALKAEGHQVTVYTMKPRRRNEQALLDLCGVPADLPIDRPRLASLPSWPLRTWRRRKGAALLLRRILASARSNPVAALQAILCIPRIVEIADSIAERGSDVVHIFWARHVGLVLPVMAVEGSNALRTAFVGAYDLTEDDFLVDLTVEAAEILFSHAEVNRPYLERKAPKGAEIYVVPRGIPLPPLLPESERDPWRWLTASALVRSKNVEAVIAAFANARRAEPRLALRIFGEGPDRQRLEKVSSQLGCSEAVEFMGHVRRDGLFIEMQRSAVFLLLSKKPSERLPNVVKEALWAGCSVVSSDSEGIGELICDRGIGFVVDPDRPDEVAEAVRAIMSETEAEAEQRRRRAREHVEKHFSSESSMRRYSDAWRLALETQV